MSPFDLVSRIIIGGSAPRHSLPPYYLFKLTGSCNISSDVMMILVFAWKPRWAVIISVNSSAKSTFDISSAPLAILAAPALSALTKPRSEEHTSELQSRGHLVYRLLLEIKQYYYSYF